MFVASNMKKVYIYSVNGVVQPWVSLIAFAAEHGLNVGTLRNVLSRDKVWHGEDGGILTVRTVNGKETRGRVSAKKKDGDEF